MKREVVGGVTHGFYIEWRPELDEINDEWFKEMEQREQEEAQEAWEPEN